MYHLNFQIPISCDEKSDHKVNSSEESCDSKNISQSISIQSDANNGIRGNTFYVNNNAVGPVKNEIHGVTQIGKKSNVIISNNTTEPVENNIRDIKQKGTSNSFNINNNTIGSVKNEIHDIEQQGTSASFIVNNDDKGDIINQISGINQSAKEDEPRKSNIYSFCEKNVNELFK